jgi:hypothetical protein
MELKMILAALAAIELSTFAGMAIFSQFLLFKKKHRYYLGAYLCYEGSLLPIAE